MSGQIDKLLKIINEKQEKTDDSFMGLIKFKCYQEIINTIVALNIVPKLKEEIEEVKKELEESDKEFQEKLKRPNPSPKYCLDCMDCLCYTCKKDNYYLENTDLYCCSKHGKANSGCEDGVNTIPCPDYEPKSFPWNIFCNENAQYVHCGCIEEQIDFEKQFAHHDLGELNNWYIHKENTCYNSYGICVNVMNLDMNRVTVYEWCDYM